jgi:hypothetical protein
MRLPEAGRDLGGFDDPCQGAEVEVLDDPNASRPEQGPEIAIACHRGFSSAM